MEGVNNEKVTKRKSKQRSQTKGPFKCKKADPNLLCWSCSTDYHFQCINISSNTHKFCEADEVKSLGYHWLCEACKKDFKSFQKARTETAVKETVIVETKKRCSL